MNEMKLQSILYATIKYNNPELHAIIRNITVHHNMTKIQFDVWKMEKPYAVDLQLELRLALGRLESLFHNVSFAGNSQLITITLHHKR